MKKKYFVRGLGVGIIFGSLIMLASYVSSGRGRMSDEEIIRRAEQLGMVQESEYVLDTESSAEEQTTEEITTEETITEETTVEETTAEETTTEKTTTEEITTEKTTTEETTAEETTTEDKTSDSGIAKITVTGGMSSEKISALLADAGIIDSATDFNEYLIKNGYDKKLETGSFTVEDGMSYAEIAKILTTKQE